MTQQPSPIRRGAKITAWIVGGYLALYALYASGIVDPLLDSIPVGTQCRVEEMYRDPGTDNMVCP